MSVTICQSLFSLIEHVELAFVWSWNVYEFGKLVIFYVGQQFELANCVMVTKTETVKNVKQIVPMKTEIKYKGLMKNLNKN